MGEFSCIRTARSARSYCGVRASVPLPPEEEENVDDEMYIPFMPSQAASNSVPGRLYGGLRLLPKNMLRTRAFAATLAPDE